MRIFVGSLIIFFGTLFMAGLLALGNPGGLGVPMLQVEHASPAQPAYAVSSQRAGSDWSRLMVALGLR